MIKTKSVYSPIDHRKDGLRILATRVRGRGLKKNRYDVWMANLGPSEELLRRIRDERITWAQFVREFKRELFDDTFVDRRNTNIKNHGQKFTLRLLQRLAKAGTITIMCHCDEDQSRCHRHVLRDLLIGNI